ncbi:MAG: PAS domain-containing protein [Desulfobulbaceae bacterium]|nr:PAS domain-containing protein [Desulfobulbaceae bacterium]
MNRQLSRDRQAHNGKADTNRLECSCINGEHTPDNGRHFLAGGETGALIHSMDWSRTPLGPVDTWPQALECAVALMLNAKALISISWGPDLILLYNDGLKSLIGDKHPHAMGKPIREVFPEIVETDRPLVERVMSGRGAAAVPNLVLPINRNGRIEEACFEYTLNPITCEDGTVGGIFAIAAETTNLVRAERRMNDLQQELENRVLERTQQFKESNLLLQQEIAERKQSEDQVPDGRAKLEAALHSMTDAVFIADAEGNFIDFNDAYVSYYRFRNREECARSFSELPAIFELFFADGKPVPLEQWAAPRALRGETVTNAEYILRRRDTGETWTGRYNFGPIRNRENEIVGAVVTAQDITELKRAEEEKQRTYALLEGITTGTEDPIVALDENFNFLYFNNAYAREFKMLWGQDIRIGTSLIEFLAPWPEYQSMAEEFWSRSLNGEFFSTIMECGTSEQEKQVYDLKFNPLYDNDGRLFGAAHIMRNITERRRNEKERERLIGELEEAIKELEGFTYSVSHDLRAPIRHLASYTHLLQQERCRAKDEKCRKYLKIINNASRKLGMLVDELLEFSRMGRADMVKTTVDLRSLVEEIVLFYSRENRHRRIQWHVHPLPEVTGDPGMLHLVFSNLIANAVKFTGRRETAVIEIGSREKDDTYEIYIKDNGIGFNMEYHDKIFGIFHRLHISEEFEGTGIGLANVLRIILRHGGRVWAEGKIGKGATFYITLPRG